MKKKYSLTSVVMAAVLLTASCSGGDSGRNAPAAADTQAETGSLSPASTTALNELDNETDWEDMADIGEVDTANEEGTGKLYVSGQKAGEVKALCYYDLASTQSELAELLAQRYGGTITTEIASSGSAYFDKLGVLIAAGDSPDIVRYDWMAYPTGTAKNMFTCLDDWLDIESPLWSGEAEVIDSFNYLGKHYYFPSDVSTNFAVIYNTRSLEEAGLENPTDPEIVAADRAKRMDTSPVYYAKCPECKYNFEEEGQNDLDTCPNCGTARKRKFKAVYSERVMRVCDDMTDPEKFGFVFDNSLGFNDDFSAILTGGEDSLYDGPIYYGSSYTQLRETNYNIIETYLDEYREAIRKAASEQ